MSLQCQYMQKMLLASLVSNGKGIKKWNAVLRECGPEICDDPSSERYSCKAAAVSKERGTVPTENDSPNPR
jgi:hypothetical protein